MSPSESPTDRQYTVLTEVRHLGARAQALAPAQRAACERRIGDLIDWLRYPYMSLVVVPYADI